MDYTNPLRMTYGFGSLNFVSAAGSWRIKPPPGGSALASTRIGAGRVEDIHVRVVTLFTQTTTPAYVKIGTDADNSKYAELNMGAAAANTAYNATDVAGTIRSNFHLLADGVTDLRVGVVAPTGGSPAGVGFLDICIAWWP